MLSPATFILLYPEFSETNPLLIQGKLLLAAARMGGPDFTIWGQPATPTTPPTPPNPPTLVDMAQASYAAHLLMTSPFGTSTLLVQPQSKSSRTPYLDQFEELELAVAGGFQVAGRVV